jgi:hypothetical protein
MSPQKVDRGGSTRLASKPVNPPRTPSSRLPARSTALPLPSSIPSLPSTKLVKKKPVPSKSNGQSQTFTRSPSVNGVRRVTGEELRRELAPPRVLPTSAHIAEAQKMQQTKSKLQATSRVPRFEPIRTPSLVSGSSASTAGSPNTNPLRRKPSNISKRNVRTSPDSMTSSEEGLSSDPLSTSFKDPYPDTVLGVTLPPSSTSNKQGPEDVINLDKYVEGHSNIDLQPPIQFYNLSSTPSTGYSPGPFSVSSTPTSMSSASPGILVSSNSKYGPRVTQPSPTRSRPPVVRQMADEKTLSLEPNGLAPLRESSSSSASTIRLSDSGLQKGKGRLSYMPAPPPSPPGRRPVVPPKHARRKSESMSPAKNKMQAADMSQRPPELAHLLETSPRKGPATAKPVRPSRDGTPEMNLRDLSPIIQSNMNSLPIARHKRQSSSESKRVATSGLMIDTKPRFAPASTRNPSPSPSQSSILSPFSSRPPTRGTTPEVPGNAEKPLKVKSSPLLESKPLSRFGFFSRRNKSETGATPVVKDTKVRKGPSAGTGHEGYGKFAFRGRSGSTTSGSGSISAGRSPSTDSAIGTTRPPSRKSSIGSKAGSDVDGFLAERLNPITLRGTGSNALKRTQSEGSQGSSTENVANTMATNLAGIKSGSSLAAQTAKRPVLLPSPISDAVSFGYPVTRSTTSESTKDQADGKATRFGLSSLSSRRASRRSFLGGKSLADNITSPKQTSPSIGAISRQYTAPTTSSGSMLSPEVLSGREGIWSGPARANTQSKAQLKPPKKWNFFQRAKSPVRKDHASEGTAAVMVPRQLPPRSVAHYAMMDAPPSLDAAELEKIMQEAESAPEPPSPPPMEVRNPQRTRSTRHGNSILLPEPPQFRPEFAGPARPASPKVTLNPRNASPEPTSLTSVQLPHLNGNSTPQDSLPRPPRPSRLAQVGRIPRVVSKRDRERKLSDASFSRPFVPTQPSPALKNGAFPQDQFVNSPELVKARNEGSISGMADSMEDREHETSSGSEPQSAYYGSGEFFHFPARKNSEQSATSSSSGLANMTATTAILPRPGAPAMEDEIWNEYDDLLDLLSTKTPKTPKTPLTGSSLGAPFQYAAFDIPVNNPPSPGPIPSREPTQLEQVGPSVASFAQRIRLPSLHDSRLLSPNPSTGTPTSAFRMSDFLTGYGERNLSFVDPVSGRLSLPANSRLSSSTTRLSLPPPLRPILTSAAPTPTVPSVKHLSSAQAVNNRRDSRLIEMAEREHMGFETMASLRFGALMTSKWLSFGRVLFSPAHFELKNPSEDRVLILDGLGKDWSYYVALTYPKAAVYNLSPDPAETLSPQPAASGAFQSLPNHRHIHHASLNSPFPFPKGFFAAVVFRFPVATSESAYRSALFECKRVLRPGGYLEVSVLDMDMLNMGSRTRSALRGLKMQMQVEEPNTSLKPISDTIQRLLGRRGFENLNRCMVGIPAAGPIPGSRDGGMVEPTSASAESSASSGKGREQLDEGKTRLATDLLSDQSGEADENITKMVAKIGRWWYSRCYENLVVQNGEIAKSIWADDALVRECEKRGTSLRLMVCYAQKPDCPVRRTISV